MRGIHARNALKEAASFCYSLHELLHPADGTKATKTQPVDPTVTDPDVPKARHPHDRLIPRKATGHKRGADTDLPDRTAGIKAQRLSGKEKPTSSSHERDKDKADPTSARKPKGPGPKAKSATHYDMPEKQLYKRRDNRLEFIGSTAIRPDTPLSVLNQHRACLNQATLYAEDASVATMVLAPLNTFLDASQKVAQFAGNLRCTNIMKAWNLWHHHASVEHPAVTLDTMASLLIVHFEFPQKSDQPLLRRLAPDSTESKVINKFAEELRQIPIDWERIRAWISHRMMTGEVDDKISDFWTFPPGTKCNKNILSFEERDSFGRQVLLDARKPVQWHTRVMVSIYLKALVKLCRPMLTNASQWISTTPDVGKLETMVCQLMKDHAPETSSASMTDEIDDSEIFDRELESMFRTNEESENKTFTKRIKNPEQRAGPTTKLLLQAARLCYGIYRKAVVLLHKPGMDENPPQREETEATDPGYANSSSVIAVDFDCKYDRAGDAPSERPGSPRSPIRAARKLSPPPSNPPTAVEARRTALVTKKQNERPAGQTTKTLDELLEDEGIAEMLDALMEGERLIDETEFVSHLPDGPAKHSDNSKRENLQHTIAYRVHKPIWARLLSQNTRAERAKGS